MILIMSQKLKNTYKMETNKSSIIKLVVSIILAIIAGIAFAKLLILFIG